MKDFHVLNQSEVARLMGLDRHIVQVLVDSGQLPSVRLTRRRYILRSDLEKFIESRRENPLDEEIAV